MPLYVIVWFQILFTFVFLASALDPYLDVPPSSIDLHNAKSPRFLSSNSRYHSADSNSRMRRSIFPENDYDNLLLPNPHRNEVICRGNIELVFAEETEPKTLLVRLSVHVLEKPPDAVAGRPLEGIGVSRKGNLSECTVLDGWIYITSSYEWQIKVLGDGPYFPKLREVTGYVVLYALENKWRDLSQWFPSLAIIHGKETFGDGYSLVLFKTSFYELGLNSLMRISSGNVLIYQNPYLCMRFVNWRRILKTPAPIPVVSEAGIEAAPAFGLSGRDEMSAGTSNQDSAAPGRQRVEITKANADLCARVFQCNPSCPSFSTYGQVQCWSYHVCQLDCPYNEPCRMYNSTASPSVRDQRPAFPPSNDQMNAFRNQLSSHRCHEQCALGCYQDQSDTDCVMCKKYRLDSRCVENCPAGTYLYKDLYCITQTDCNSIPVSKVTPKPLTLGRGSGKDRGEQEFAHDRYKVVEGMPAKCIPRCDKGFRLEVTARYVNVTQSTGMPTSASFSPRTVRPTSNLNSTFIYPLNSVRSTPKPNHGQVKVPIYTCTPCKSIADCPKVCNPTELGIKLGVIKNMQNAQLLEGCTEIAGSLTIQLQGTASADSQSQQLLLKYLGAIEKVTEYVKIFNSFPLVSLNFLQNLKEIQGKLTEKSNAAFTVRGNENLETLWNIATHAPLTILQGFVEIQDNSRLCEEEVRKFSLSLNLTDSQAPPSSGATAEEIIASSSSSSSSSSQAKTNSSSLSSRVFTSNNGHRSACRVHPMELKVKNIRHDDAILSWRILTTMESDVERTFAGYLILYREAPSTSLTIYSDRDACGVDQWDQIDMPMGNQVTQHSYPLKGLKPYTLYAVYMKTYVTSGTADTALSNITYFRTRSFRPEEPIIVSPVDSTLDKITIRIKPPKKPNGIITHYYFFIEKADFELSSRDSSLYCRKEKKMANLVESAERKPSVDQSELGSQNNSCPASQSFQFLPQLVDTLLGESSKKLNLNMSNVTRLDTEAYIGQLLDQLADERRWTPTEWQRNRAVFKLLSEVTRLQSSKASSSGLMLRINELNAGYYFSKLLAFEDYIIDYMNPTHPVLSDMAPGSDSPLRMLNTSIDVSYQLIENLIKQAMNPDHAYSSESPSSTEMTLDPYAEISMADSSASSKSAFNISALSPQAQDLSKITSQVILGFLNDYLLERANLSYIISASSPPPALDSNRRDKSMERVESGLRATTPLSFAFDTYLDAQTSTSARIPLRTRDARASNTQFQNLVGPGADHARADALDRGSGSGSARKTRSSENESASEDFSPSESLDPLFESLPLMTPHSPTTVIPPRSSSSISYSQIINRLEQFKLLFNVSANSSDIQNTFTNLEKYTYYKISVFACQQPGMRPKEKGPGEEWAELKDLCSKPAQEMVQTKGQPSSDRVENLRTTQVQMHIQDLHSDLLDQTNVFVDSEIENFLKGQSSVGGDQIPVTAINIEWDDPASPNGNIIYNYHFSLHRHPGTQTIHSECFSVQDLPETVTTKAPTLTSTLTTRQIPTTQSDFAASHSSVSSPTSTSIEVHIENGTSISNASSDTGPTFSTPAYALPQRGRRRRSVHSLNEMNSNAPNEAAKGTTTKAAVASHKYLVYLGSRAQPGNYTVTFQAESLLGIGEPNTYQFTIEPPAASLGLAGLLIITLSSAVVFLVCVTTLTLVVLFKVRNKQKKCVTTSVNPDYYPTNYVVDEWEIDRDKVKMLNELGQGSFGMVFEGIVSGLEQRTGSPEIHAAIKTVNETASVKEFLEEANIMKKFTECNHVVKLIGVVSRSPPVLVVMELLSLGDLKTFLRRHRPDAEKPIGRPPPTYRDIIQIAGEVADGMSYLAAKKFVHRDLAARNCMVAGDYTVKIGDFGMARDVYDSDYYRKGCRGLLPVRWMSPEALRDGLFTTASDVWSYGVVMWETVTLSAQPYQGLSNEQVLRHVIDGHVLERPPGCPERLYALMRLCWRFDQRRRPNFFQIIQLLEPELRYQFRDVSWFYKNRACLSAELDEAFPLEEFLNEMEVIRQEDMQAPDQSRPFGLVRPSRHHHAADRTTSEAALAPLYPLSQTLTSNGTTTALHGHHSPVMNSSLNHLAAPANQTQSSAQSLHIELQDINGNQPDLNLHSSLQAENHVLVASGACENPLLSLMSPATNSLGEMFDGSSSQPASPTVNYVQAMPMSYAIDDSQSQTLLDSAPANATVQYNRYHSQQPNHVTFANKPSRVLDDSTAAQQQPSALGSAQEPRNSIIRTCSTKTRAQPNTYIRQDRTPGGSSGNSGSISARPPLSGLNRLHSANDNSSGGVSSAASNLSYTTIVASSLLPPITASDAKSSVFRTSNSAEFASPQFRDHLSANEVFECSNHATEPLLAGHGTEAEPGQRRMIEEEDGYPISDFTNNNILEHEACVAPDQLERLIELPSRSNSESQSGYSHVGNSKLYGRLPVLQTPALLSIPDSQSLPSMGSLQSTLSTQSSGNDTRSGRELETIYNPLADDLRTDEHVDETSFLKEPTFGETANGEVLQYKGVEVFTIFEGAPSLEKEQASLGRTHGQKKLPVPANSFDRELPVNGCARIPQSKSAGAPFLQG